MKGWNIFVHSVRLVFTNLTAALKISAVFYIAQIVLGLMLGLSVYEGDAAMQAQMTAGDFPWLWFVLLLVFALVTNLWIAVAWHRYILTGEQPGIIPPFHGDRILGYFGKGILIGLILILPAMLAVFVGGAVAFPLIGGSMENILVPAIMLVVLLPIWVAGLRLGTALPGVALRAGERLGSGWEATKGHAGTLIVVAICTLVATLVLELIGVGLAGLGEMPVMVWSLVTAWVTTMVGVSILTTLYGHYIEKRELT
jgi:hypothetical protein